MTRNTAILTVLALFSYVAKAYQDIEDIARTIASTDVRNCYQLTNDLAQIAESATNAQDKATCCLFKAYILLDHSETLSFEPSFIETTNLCRIVETELSQCPAWQRVAALNIYTTAMIEDGHPGLAYISSTNLLNFSNSNAFSTADTNMWNAIFKSDGLDVMCLQEYILLNAARALFSENPLSDLYQYTNSLPKAVIDEILDK